jgi:hypothetical protein
VAGGCSSDGGLRGLGGGRGANESGRSAGVARTWMGTDNAGGAHGKPVVGREGRGNDVDVGRDARVGSRSGEADAGRVGSGSVESVGVRRERDGTGGRNSGQWRGGCGCDVRGAARA